MKKAMRLLLAVAAIVLPQQVMAQEAPIVLHPWVWEGFQEYLGLNNPSAFAVSRDGTTYGYSYCPERRCRFNTDKRTALDSCTESGGEDCFIFAIKEDIRVAYQVLDLTASRGCPALASSDVVPEITVVADIDEVVYDYAQDISELTNLDMRGKSRVNPVDFELLGLTIHQFSRGGDDVGTTTVSGENGACAGMTNGTIHLRMVTTIYVAKEFPASTCLYREILAHEERHHAVGVEYFQKFAEAATRALRADLIQKPYVAVGDAAMASAVAAARIDFAIDAAAGDFQRRYDEAQSAIDTDAEYARVATACADARSYLK